jgi:hypothetical protein
MTPNLDTSNPALMAVLLPGVEDITLEDWDRLTWSQKLRWPFPTDLVCYRPQPWCKACNDAKSRVCSDHKKQWCDTCRQSLTEAHADLAYIGHADVNERLDLVDPEWSWRHIAVSLPPEALAHPLDSSMALQHVIENSLPRYDNEGGLWIEMTVHNDKGDPIQRFGYGDAPGKRGSSAIKEIIGDAIRNAAMRYGVARYLWSRSDIALAKAGREPAKRAQRSRPARSAAEIKRPPAGDGVSPAQVLAQTAFEYAKQGSGKTIEQLRTDCHEKASEARLLREIVRSPIDGQEVALSKVIQEAKAILEGRGGQ